MNAAEMRAIIAAGGTVEMLLAAKEAEEAEAKAKIEERRRKAREKKRRQRAGLSPSVPGDTGGHSGQPSPPKKESSPTPPKEKTTPSPDTPSSDKSLSGVSPRQATARAPKVPIGDFEPSIDEAVERGLTVDQAKSEAVKFVAHHRKHDIRLADWSAGWTKWNCDAVDRSKGKELPHDTIYRALAKAVDDEHVAADHPWFDALCDIAESRTGKRPAAIPSRDGFGRRFPAAIVDELRHHKRAVA